MFKVFQIIFVFSKMPLGENSLKTTALKIKTKKSILPCFYWSSKESAAIFEKKRSRDKRCMMFLRDECIARK